MTEKIKVVGTSDISDQPIIGQEQPTISKADDLSSGVVIASTAPGVSAPQMNGMEVSRNAVFDIGNMTEYIHFDGTARTIQSSNFITSVSGWIIRGDGSVEFGSGYFRGDITGATGTFSGTVTGSIGALGGFIVDSNSVKDVANSFGLTSTVTGGNDVRFWSGTTLANAASAPLRIYEDGSIVCTNINATGAIFATSGWIGAPTALVYEAQGINTGTTGFIRGGQTSYNTGTGYFLGYDTGAYKFSIGNGTSGYYLTWDGSQLVVNDSVISNNDIYGDGSDGNVVISADTSLTTDMYYNNLTINTGKVLNPNGFRIFVKGTLTFLGTGKISVAGGDAGNGVDATPGAASNNGGAGGTKGTAKYTSTGTLPQAYDGSDGGGGASGNSTSCSSNGGAGSAAGADIAKALSGAGSAGGNGGQSSTANCTIGSGGSGRGISGTIFNKINNAIAAYFLFDVYPAFAAFTNAGASGSGGGGESGRTGGGGHFGGGGGGGGGSGATGGVISLFARKIVTVNGNVFLDVSGGNGGNGGNGGDATAAEPTGRYGGGGGGGAGGRGGTFILIYSSKSGTGTTDITGGTGGTKGLKGDGTSGNATNGTDGGVGVGITLII